MKGSCRKGQKNSLEIGRMIHSNLLICMYSETTRLKMLEWKNIMKKSRLNARLFADMWVLSATDTQRCETELAQEVKRKLTIHKKFELFFSDYGIGVSTLTTTKEEKNSLLHCAGIILSHVNLVSNLQDQDVVRLAKQQHRISKTLRTQQAF